MSAISWDFMTMSCDILSQSLTASILPCSARRLKEASFFKEKAETAGPRLSPGVSSGVSRPTDPARSMFAPALTSRSWTGAHPAHHHKKTLSASYERVTTK